MVFICLRLVSQLPIFRRLSENFTYPKTDTTSAGLVSELVSTGLYLCLNEQSVTEFISYRLTLFSVFLLCLAWISSQLGVKTPIDLYLIEIYLLLARSFIIKKFSKIFINLKQAFIIKSITHTITLMNTESLFHWTLSSHTMTVGLGSGSSSSVASSTGSSRPSQHSTCRHVRFRPRMPHPRLGGAASVFCHGDGFCWKYV